MPLFFVAYEMILSTGNASNPYSSVVILLETGIPHFEPTVSRENKNLKMIQLASQKGEKMVK